MNEDTKHVTRIDFKDEGTNKNEKRVVNRNIYNGTQLKKRTKSSMKQFKSSPLRTQNAYFKI